MRLPRLTPITTVRIYLKSGAIMENDFYTFDWKYNGNDGVTNLKWRTADGEPFWVDLDSIAGIDIAGRKTRLRIRDAA